MATGTMSRVLLSALVCPLIAYGVYALFGTYPLWGALFLVGSLVLLFLIWRTAFIKSEAAPEHEHEKSKTHKK